jgi:hypothetical protein
MTITIVLIYLGCGTKHFIDYFWVEDGTRDITLDSSCHCCEYRYCISTQVYTETIVGEIGASRQPV